MPSRNDSTAARRPASVADFYDGLAPDYHLVYGDRWDDAVDRQGVALDRLLRSLRPQANDILDCSCGIGTQAIGLARRGYRVCGTDISERSLERARVEAARLGVSIAFGVADFRDLRAVTDEFDVVLSFDNAIPHLLTDAEVLQALQAMRSKLRPGGLLVISIRDYDRGLVERPATAAPLLIDGPPRRVVVRLHDWDAPDSPLHTVRFLVLTETAERWTVEHHSVRYRAITSRALTEAAQAAGFTDVTWISGEDAGFHQPVMTAVAGGVMPPPRPAA
jgi:glycine/sarcosine N-methyltransferase